MVSAKTARVLARCNGFRVEACDHVVGAVATPVFSGVKLLPDYLLVRIEAAIPGIFRAVPPELVAAADAASETVVLNVDLVEVASLPVPPTLDRVSPATAPLHDYGAIGQHRLPTSLAVIRDSALTLRDRSGLPTDEVRKLADAIERAACELARGILDPFPLEAQQRTCLPRTNPERLDAEPATETELSSHSAVAMRVARRAVELATRKTLTPADVDLLELGGDELRGCTH
jgi:hypothetical protein